VVTEVDRTQRLVADHPRGLAVDADETQAAEQVQVSRQGHPQLLFHAQAILQQHHLGIGCGGLDDQRCELDIAG